MKPRKKSQTNEAEVICRFMESVCRQCFNRAQVQLLGESTWLWDVLIRSFSALDTNYSIFFLSHEKNL